MSIKIPPIKFEYLEYLDERPVTCIVAIAITNTIKSSNINMRM